MCPFFLITNWLRKQMLGSQFRALNGATFKVIAQGFTAEFILAATAVGRYCLGAGLKLKNP